uniref:Putative secreted protein n=1 Tax=Amblyomma americanum TaxID=6943 RepID=A0A0C9SER5_AMBAM
MGTDNHKRAEMQLLTVFALLCVLGSTLSDGVLPMQCKQRVKPATSTCSNGQGPIKRFRYLPRTKKCDEFWESSCMLTKHLNSKDSHFAMPEGSYRAYARAVQHHLRV